MYLLCLRVFYELCVTASVCLRAWVAVLVCLDVCVSVYLCLCGCVCVCVCVSVSVCLTVCASNTLDGKHKVSLLLPGRLTSATLGQESWRPGR